ncbi:MAG TPA: NAD(P)H-quinone oxidoreductase [Gemmatimonadaceae bacterium]|nr:NAD(P)H-quinone oxidoreductase [Gemmatimonadaceae bacterium]
MKAVVITRPGGPEVLQLQDRPTPEPGPFQIRVRVHASALNRADLSQRRGNYPAPPGFPADISGMEYAGEVESLGEGATRWDVGARVMGIIGGGGHAEFVCVHERESIAVPALFSWEEAAAIPEVFLTAYDALFRQMDVRVGETVLIHAVASGVGTAGLQLACSSGAAVVGTSRSAAKLARAKQLGLDIAIDTSQSDWATAVEAQVGIDSINAIMDLVGGDYVAGDLRVLSPRGRIIVVGTTAGAKADINLGLLLRKRARIIGTVLRARTLDEKIALAEEFSERVLTLFETGHVKPVVDRVFPFTEIKGAHELMESNETFGKIVLRW